MSCSCGEGYRRPAQQPLRGHPLDGPLLGDDAHGHVHLHAQYEDDDDALGDSGSEGEHDGVYAFF